MKITLIALLALGLCLVGCGHSQKSFFQRTLEKAEAGDAKAQIGLGDMYSTGVGVLEDDKEAAKWYRKAAEQGNAYGQQVLGVMYSEGEGVEKDAKEAVKWYRKAAEQGNANGQYGLAQMYWKGVGVLEDEKEASKWFRKAAHQGHASSQFNLGLHFQYGVGGVRQDYVYAYAWYNIAAANGKTMAQKQKLKLAKKMTPDQITKGEALAKEMIKKNPKLLAD